MQFPKEPKDTQSQFNFLSVTSFQYYCFIWLFWLKFFSTFHKKIPDNPVRFSAEKIGRGTPLKRFNWLLQNSIFTKGSVFSVASFELFVQIPVNKTSKNWWISFFSVQIVDQDGRGYFWGKVLQEDSDYSFPYPSIIFDTGYLAGRKLVTASAGGFLIHFLGLSKNSSF